MAITISEKINKALKYNAPENKDSSSRLTQYINWLNSKETTWLHPQLSEYANYLISDPRGLSPRSINAHLSSIRKQIRCVLKSDIARDYLLALAYQQPHVTTPADALSVMNEVISRIQNSIAPEQTSMKEMTYQDTADSDHIRLTVAQANELLRKPGKDSLKGLRDTAIIALLLTTGIREGELTALDVDDLRQRSGGELALRVREGKGAKQRLVPYGQLAWVLIVVEVWLTHAEIVSGKVFRGFYKGAKKIRETAITTRSIQRILNDYPLVIDGELMTVKPHDLRRTYARRLFDAGVKIEAIQQNLGHTNLTTTQAYIGRLDTQTRQPPHIYEFDVDKFLKRYMP